MNQSIILKQILILAILVLTGFLASKVKVITAASKDLLAKIIYNITLPLLLLTNFSHIDITPRILSNSLLILLLAAFVILFMLFIGWVTTKVFRMEPGEAKVFKVHSMLGNIAYMGFPVILAVFGKEGLLYASIFSLVSNLLMWTVGVLIINQGKKISTKENLRHIINPNLVAVITGFVLFIASIKLPKFFLDSLGSLGGTTTNLSMLYIGSVLYFANVKQLAKNKIVYILSMNKLIIVPSILLGLFILINTLLPVGIDPLVISVLIMQAAMPCMVSVVIMINVLGEDDSLATANVFVSTLLCIITLPFMMLLLTLFI